MCMTTIWEVFDSPRVCVGDLNIEVRQGSQPAAFPARERDGPAARGIAVFHRAENIRGVAGAADRDQDILRLGKILQLLDENAFVADVVGVGGDGGERIGERQDAEAGSPAVAGALDQVGGEMRSGGGAPAIPAHEDPAPVGAGLGQDFDRLAHLLRGRWTSIAWSSSRFYTVAEKSLDLPSNNTALGSGGNGRIVFVVCRVGQSASEVGSARNGRKARM